MYVCMDELGYFSHLGCTHTMYVHAYVCTKVCFTPGLFPHALARLRSIEETIQCCTNTLYRACANASPQDMNDAMIGVSQQVNIMSLSINAHICLDMERP